MKRAFALLIAVLLGAIASFGQIRYSATGAVINSRHDLSITSTGSTYKASTQTQVCVFCHTPHNTNPASPLWNHQLSGTTYTLYTSSTLSATMAQPLTGSNTKLCLSCHDGTVALGNTVNDGSIVMQNSVTTLPATAGNTYSPPRSTNLGTTLADDHPVAFTQPTPVLPAYPQVQTPVAGDPVQLENGLLECTSCHDPHNEATDPTERRFLRKSNSAGAICTTCHVLQSASIASVKWSWSGSLGQRTDHATAVNAFTAATNAGGITWLGSHTGYSTTATNGCNACHRSHAPHDTARLMKGDTDTVCFQCHDGNTTTNILFPAPLNTTVQNVKAQFTTGTKTYIHPGAGATQTGHDPNETPLISTSRHGACDDCHNPHASKNYTTLATPPAVQTAVVGVSGITLTGAVRDPRRNGDEVQFEYEICLKCHGDSTNKPQSTTYTTYGYTATRSSYSGLTDPYNVRLQFTATINTNVGSRHPVMYPRGSTASQVSLRTFMLNRDGTTNSTRSLGTGTSIYCSDCHATDNDREFAGTGTTNEANGVHGSIYPHILERNYVTPTPPATPGQSFTTVGGSTSASATAVFGLCAKCHDLSKVQNEGVHGEGDHFSAGCSVCHAAHGVQNSNTTTTGFHVSLVDFDTKIVAPNTGATTYTYPAYDGKHCYLQCHGTRHDANNP